MQTRHRVPTVFTLYMVDVLCCALGCVILLWFLKLHEAKIQVEKAERREKAAAATSADLAKTRTHLEKTEARLVEVSEHRNAILAQVAALDQELGKLKVQKADTEDRLAKAVRARGDLAKELADARQRAATLEMLVREKEALARTNAQSADALTARLRTADARVKQLQPLADEVPGLRRETQTYRDQLAALQTRAQDLEKEFATRKQDLLAAGKSLHILEETNGRLSREVDARTKELTTASRSIEKLQDERKVLNEQVSRERADKENRFAGIGLTGRRVVFLVDMSGSMDLVDERTLAPDKWSGVRRTVAKIMRSLPDLERFQVIVFSEQVSYLIGDGNSWLDYDARTSVDRVSRALAAIKPHGQTNMYTALQAAFRFRQAGLDTIYVLSDGLPNLGPGLTATQEQTLDEDGRAVILSKVIRAKLKDDWNRKIAVQPRVHINTIGFFYESPDVGAFLWAMARENEGSFVGMSKP